MSAFATWRILRTTASGGRRMVNSIASLESRATSSFSALPSRSPSGTLHALLVQLAPVSPYHLLPPASSHSVPPHCRGCAHVARALRSMRRIGKAPGTDRP
ncbi:hypothetical protein MSAN_01985100 [Mycena sanguinolenta]|uniref:Uncharacterized protein n=1 Tax=Mycena sanguinolenta TaxID=230812 RepID=A0A8H6XNH8_9AGAR|nr:hypothetical protein MSAN_01985100 [Mycena sanguinolenta]